MDLWIILAIIGGVVLIFIGFALIAGGPTRGNWGGWSGPAGPRLPARADELMEASEEELARSRRDEGRDPAP
jgi:hypothetical protein